VDAVVKELRDLGAEVATGVFGAQMSVSLTNEGPFTVIVEV
jgi:D-tyrosyl-tRNA(Tyr) deacylase